MAEESVTILSIRDAEEIVADPNVWGGIGVLRRQGNLMPSANTRCTCGEGHETFGACLRSKNLSYVGVFATRSYGDTRGGRTGYGDRDRQKAWDRELNTFVDARRQGVMPAGTKQWQTDAAMQMSEKEGVAWDASKNDFSDNRLRKLAAGG